MKDELLKPWKECFILVNGFLAFVISLAAIETAWHSFIIYCKKHLHVHLPNWLEPAMAWLLAGIIGVAAIFCAAKHAMDLWRFLFRGKHGGE